MSEVRDSEVGSTGPEETEFHRLKKMVREGHAARSDWRTEAKMAFDIVANHQWSENDKLLLEGQNRPAVSFNRTAPIIKAVCGLEVNNRQMVAYLPRKVGNSGLDESRTAAGKWMRDLADAEDEESEAFRDLTICGEGWTEARMDYDVNPKGQYAQERVDPLEMGVNSGAGRANFKDARLVYRVREMDSEDAQALLGAQYLPDVLHAAWLEDTTPADGGQGDKKDYPSTTRAGLERESGKRTKVRIVQVQWWEREPIHLLALDGVPELKELKSDEFKAFEDRVTQMRQMDLDATMAFSAAVGSYDPASGLEPPVAPTPTAPSYKAARVMRRCYYEAFLGTDMIGKKKLEFDEFTFKAMTGERDRKKKCFYGMVRDMVDPQRWANKWLSQTMHIMNTNAKGGIMAETDAFVNQRKAEKDWADNTKIVWVKPGSLEKNKIKERTPPPLPQGLGELMQFALSSLRDTTGVNLELLGQADREQAASLEAQRRQSAMTTLATLFDSLRRYRKEQGRLQLKFIELMPEGTLIRVLEKGQYKYIPLIKQGDINEYDVVIDQAPTSPDQKQAIWAITSQLLGSGLDLPMPVIVKLLKYSPYPESVVEEISEAMGLGGTEPPEVLQQKLQQAEAALKVMEAALKVMEAALKKATDEAETEEQKNALEADRVGIEGYRAETERLRVRLDAMEAKQSATEPAVPSAAVPPAGGPAQSYGGNEELVQRVDNLAAMMQQILQAVSPQEPAAQPVAEQPEETFAE